MMRTVINVDGTSRDRRSDPPVALVLSGAVVPSSEATWVSALTNVTEGTP